MSKKNLRLLYYLAWAIGLVAVAALAYGIVRELLR